MSASAAVPVVPTRRRRWLRFGLRTFLVVVALAGAGLGWKVRQVRQQRAAVEWVRAQGGTVYYDFEWDSASHQVIAHAKPSAAIWLRPLGGIDFVARPVVVELGTSRVADLTPLAGLTGLKVLYLSNTQVSDIAPLSSLTGLRVLSLSNTNVADVRPLSKLTELRALTLSLTQVSNLAPLSNLRALEFLILTGAPASDEAVTAFRRNRPSVVIIRKWGGLPTAPVRPGEREDVRGEP